MDDAKGTIERLTQERDEALQLAVEACARLDIVTAQHEDFIAAIHEALDKAGK